MVGWWLHDILYGILLPHMLRTMRSMSGESRSDNQAVRLGIHPLQLWPFISYNWLQMGLYIL